MYIDDVGGPRGVEEGRGGVRGEEGRSVLAKRHNHIRNALCEDIRRLFNGI
jgi:hypothetical protein